MNVPGQPGTGGPPAGWHDDPQDPTQLRYWDGQQWTEHRSPKAGQAAAPAITPVPGAAPVGQVGVQPVAVSKQKNNGMAVASLVLSLVSLLLWPAAILGVIFGFVARSQLAERPHETGGGMATAGIVCGIVFGVLGLLWMIYVLNNGGY
jgi:hypothetical protein